MYEFITQHKDEFKVLHLCQVLKISKSAYYAYCKGQSYQLSSNTQVLLKEVKAIFYFHKRRYGALRIWEEMKDKGYKIGLYKVRSLMKRQGLVAIQPKRFVPKTTKNSPHLRRSPNLLLDLPFPTAPNMVIVGDITYLPLCEAATTDWLYLAIWMDLFSRKIVGWKVDDNMEALLIIDPLKQVIKSRQPPKGMIVHSDGGGQYGSIEFRALIGTHKFKQSMTRKDNHYDNAFSESLFSRFKAELLDGGVFQDLYDARISTFEYIEGYYNTIRKHSSLGYISPVQFEDKYWIDYWRNNKT